MNKTAGHFVHEYIKYEFIIPCFFTNCKKVYYILIFLPIAFAAMVSAAPLIHFII